MKPIITFILLLICVLITFLICSYIFNAVKESEINNLNDQINDLETRLNEYIGTADMFVGTWNRTLGDPHEYYDTMVLYSNNTGFLTYFTSGIDPVNYSIKDGKLAFEWAGYPLREFSFTFHNDHTMIMVESEESEGFSVYTKV